MMNIFLIADTHFGHHGVTQFLRDDGSKLRPWDTYEEMDEALVANWNSVVSPNDKVYLLGDAVINRRALPTIGRCNGNKVLIKGNHDIFKIDEYTAYFYDIRGYHVLNQMILSHIPIHEESLSRFNANIHGHLHHRRVMKNGLVDPRYISVSVELIDYTPVPFETIREMVRQNTAKEPGHAISNQST